MVPISTGRLARQLQSLGDDRADLLTSLAGGVTATLEDNPVLEALTAPVQFSILAILYGTARRACTECISDPLATPEMISQATKALASMDELVPLTDAADPNPPARYTRPTMEQIMGTLNEVINGTPAETETLPSDIADPVQPTTEGAGSSL